MQSKLDKLVADPNFGIGANDFDTGIMIYNQESLNYVILTYDDDYEVYLSLFDDTRDYLVSSTSSDIDVTKQIAIEKIDRKINRLIH